MGKVKFNGKLLPITISLLFLGAIPMASPEKTTTLLTYLTQDDIQQAIDALPKEGGVVQLKEGVYLVKRSIQLRSGVTLRGAGSQTVLRKALGREA